MLIDLLTDADCTCLWTLAITAHGPCCATHTDHLTKVVQTLYLVYIPPNEMGSPQTAHLCILPSQLQPGFHRSYYPHYRQHLLGNCLPCPHLLPCLSCLSYLLSASQPGTLNDTLTLIFVYSLVGIFALLLLASLVYFALRCLEPPLSEP